LALTTRAPLPGLDIVARPHHKLAGLRIDPKSRGPQLGTQVLGITLRSVQTGEERPLAIPPGHWSGPFWSADDRAFFLLRAVEGGAELWLADPATAPPAPMDGVRVNQVLRAGVHWLPDQVHLVLPLVTPGVAPERPTVPAGPQVQDSTPGEKAPVRTYQDLLQDAHDEALLEFFGQSQLAIVDTRNRKLRPIGGPGLYERIEASPDGHFLLVERIERPFSYVHPLPAFPRQIDVLDLDGTLVRTVAKTPMRDAVPIGGVPTGPRGIDWIPVLPHTLAWCEALDGGDPNKVVPQRDVVMRLAEPTATATPWFQTEHRFSGAQYGSDGAFTMAVEMDRRTRRQRVWSYDAKDTAKGQRTISF
jgi:hypothetical protein